MNELKHLFKVICLIFIFITLGMLANIIIFPYDSTCVGYWSNCTNTGDWETRECFIECLSYEEYMQNIVFFISCLMISLTLGIIIIILNKKEVKVRIE